MKQGSWTKQGNREEGRSGLALRATHLQPPGKGWGRLVEHVAGWWAAYSSELVVTVTVIIILCFLSWASIFLSQQKRCYALFSLDANTFSFLCHPPMCGVEAGKRERACARAHEPCLWNKVFHWTCHQLGKTDWPVSSRNSFVPAFPVLGWHACTNTPAFLV